jgi:ribonuclease HII
MQPFLFDQDVGKLEIGVDEAGRGPMFGRVYAAAVVLPRGMDCSMIKDSKKFTSLRKLTEAARYIEANATAYSVTFEDEQAIDRLNISEATQSAMHHAIRDVALAVKPQPVVAIVDGNFFRPLVDFDPETDQFTAMEAFTLTKGDAKLASIAAASILAKWHRDEYVREMCVAHPALDDIYGIAGNKGYGSKPHMDAIREHGTSPWHRMTFGICATIGKQCTAFESV